ncbi:MULTISPECIES: heterodisulfide reductase-related iron-sulfur binding cluster [Leptospira]|uniref:Cysteine-rich domain protein n=4 Tax=Leptospira weilii TaxID=28184 RepID=A0A828YY06_9LEPT|nr:MULTISPECIES: heterodisulfide reductase-related iron-sulfur binding cluster [Leptospira]EMM73842.1 cysteine-rich domain protein [Leptospira weilii str. 2006001855]EMY14167.1 cysteine-rich domain protein [Leptospira weilii str. Ecochallenge]EKR62305.1 cysteine-rich domain protein [Leptospira weilii str. 2006001853]EMJ65890.1 cysteine-rich domain protein [Leptospira sp. P2653]EMN42555.1 cysteine-rich domain protein [Leptospira weilii str. LNT 1234]
MAILQIAFHLIFTVLFVIANVVFIRAILYRLRLIFNARKAAGTENFLENPNWIFRINSFFQNVILQKKNFKEPLRGIMHAFIFYGFVTYLLHTTSQMIAGLIGYGMDDPYKFSLISFLFGESTGHLYESIVQVVSILVLIGLGFFAWRRWVQKAKGLDVHSPASAIVIGMISILMISTLLGEGAKAVGAVYDSPTENASLIAAGIGAIWKSIGVEYSTADVVVQIMWWAHILSVFAFMLYVPTSKHAHLIFAPFNYFLQSDTPKGALSKLNLEDENVVWGVNRVEDFPWPNLLDGMSCIECGRCQVQCPANRTGKVLNPKAIIADLKHALLDKMPEVAKIRAEESDAAVAAEKIAALDTGVINNYEGLSEEALWGCTTCYACVEACPVGNNQVNAIMEMRRHLVLAESKFPVELQNAFVNMENNSNPWGVGAHTRADWAEGLGVKTMAEDSNVDVLYWVGCAGAFDDRNKSIAKSFVKILQKADVKFGILGTEENCSGDSARRGGNEYLYQTLAQANVDTMNGYNVKKVVTACPHCYNTIKNEYPQFGGNFEVVHHSEFINQLVKEKKLDVKTAEDASSGKYTYHDSCYIGRYNDNYENPRDVVKKVSGGKLAEPSDHHTKGLCCGAGGAQMWMEEQNNDRVNIKRTKQLLDTGATTIATACPFCVTMITDGVKHEGKIEEVKVKDIAELVADNLQ